MEAQYISYDLDNEPHIVPVAFYPAVIIVQARMGSTRLPGKVLTSICKKPMLQILLERLQQVVSADMLCIATTVNPEDDVIETFCNQHSVHCFRGDSEDVLSRYYTAAQGFDADVVVRITSDCPLIDPVLVDRALFCFRNHYDDLDYFSNTLHRTYPRGMDIEIFRMSALERAFFCAKSLYEKEHVTPFMQQDHTLRLGNFIQKIDQAFMRFTVDTQEDLLLVQRIYERLPNKNVFHLQDIIQIVSHDPELLKINVHIQQKG